MKLGDVIRKDNVLIFLNFRVTFISDDHNSIVRPDKLHQGTLAIDIFYLPSHRDKQI